MNLRKIFQLILLIIFLIIGFILMMGDILQKILGAMLFVYVLTEAYNIFKKPIPFVLDVLQIAIVSFFIMFTFVNDMHYLFILIAVITELWLIFSLFKDYIVLIDD